MDPDALLAEQIAYYRARAGEYDDWWQRRHEYDLGPDFIARWEADVDALGGWLAEYAPRGHVLELAAGTGNWTGRLLCHADLVTAVDASPEVLALNAAKHGTDRVEHVVADLFAWDPPYRYDAVFFSFWLSHVPAARWGSFWRLVGRALAPGAPVMFIDNAHPGHAGAIGPGDWPEAARLREPDAAAPGDETRVRRLRDGSAFTIVKRYWHPCELTAELAENGWHAVVRQTSFAFLYGIARPLDRRFRPAGNR